MAYRPHYRNQPRQSTSNFVSYMNSLLILLLAGALFLVMTEVLELKRDAKTKAETVQNKAGSASHGRRIYQSTR